jgi:hypothetical protein
LPYLDLQHGTVLRIEKYFKSRKKQDRQRKTANKSTSTDFQASIEFPKEVSKKLKAVHLVELSEALFASNLLSGNKTIWYRTIGEFFGVSLKNWSGSRDDIINRSGSPTMFLDKIAQEFNDQIQRGLEK